MPAETPPENPPSQEWAHLPDGCPDPAYPATNGPVFRLVRGQPDDYWTQFESGGYPEADECRRKSLSVYNARQHAEYALTIYTRYSEITRADLTEEHGRIKRTGSNKGHCSLWLRMQFENDRAALFRVEQ